MTKDANRSEGPQQFSSERRPGRGFAIGAAYSGAHRDLLVTLRAQGRFRALQDVGEGPLPLVIR